MDAEFDNPRYAISSLCKIFRKREMKVRSNSKIGGKPLEVICPARFTVCIVTGGAGAMKEPLAITVIRRCHC